MGTGTGAVAVRAARAGAKVTGSDLAPALIETAKRLADEEGLEIRYEVGDAEQLPYADGGYDIVSSSFAAIFAPTHTAVARELARVTRSGGRLGLTAWDPEGGIGDSFRLLGRFQPPPPQGAGNPLDWGREAHARELIAEGFIGHPYHVDAIWYAERQADPNIPLLWRHRKETAGFGVLGDIGSHVIDILRWILGDFRKVSAHCLTVMQAEASAQHLQWMRERSQDYSSAVRVRLEMGYPIPAAQYLAADESAAFHAKRASRHLRSRRPSWTRSSSDGAC